MAKIKVMDEILQNKIAAGEVIERIVSIVKELVENSIDADSSEIKIELIESGLREIKVIDDGIGMDNDDALLAFQRHATSKIYTDDDLFSIESLGFRGEALPSIAAVSDVILKTCKKGSNVGTLIHIKGGHIIEQESSDARTGTSITVTNLFYNTPARLKHLSSPYTELSNVIEYLNKIALSYPNTKFTLINDGKYLLNTDGSNNLLKVINAIYGIDITKKMFPIEGCNSDYNIKGYISLPEVTRSSKNYMTTIVNGRVIKNTTLYRIINEAYANYKEMTRYPVVVLCIDTDPSLIDVNIHPSKLDIKFSNFEDLQVLITNTIINGIKNKLLIPKIEVEKVLDTPKYENLTLNLEREIHEDTIPYGMEENKKVDKNCIISYHLEIAKLCGIFKNSKKSFNAIFEAANDIKLKDAIRQEPKIIHISCHGRKPENDDNDYALVLENRGRIQKLGKREIEQLLASVQEKLKNIDLVVLSSCHSEVAGKLFLKYGVKNVIYINKKFEISNTASLDFDISFYQKLIDCQTLKSAFSNTIQELLKQERDNFKDKENILCCCSVHKIHDKHCYLSDKKQKEKIHKELHVKTCNCKFEEFCMHNKNCEILIGVNNFNKCNKKKNNKINVEKINNHYKICCGCDKDVKDLHHFGESFRFILEGQDDKSGDIIIYGDNKEGKFQYNKNCHIVEDIEDYKDNFLFLIERREKVLDIYDIISDLNPKEHFIIIYGEAGVGKFNFSKSVCIYLKERKVIHNFITLKIVRSIDIIISQLPHKTSTEEKYIFIIEIDNELQTPINLVNEILADNRLVDRDFFYFILLNTKEDKINTKIENNQKTTKFINLIHLSDNKALQLYGELRIVYRYKKDYLNDDEKKNLIQLIGNSRKEMLPLLKIIEKKNRYDDVVQHIKEKKSKKESVKGELKSFIESQGGEIIFLLYIFDNFAIL